MSTINRHYKLVAQEMRENDQRIKELCQLYMVGNEEKINKLVLENIELQEVVDVLLEYRRMGQVAKGNSYDCDKVMLVPFNTVTINTCPEKGMTGQIVSFGKSRGGRRYCVMKLKGSLRLVRRMGKNLVSSDKTWTGFYKAMKVIGFTKL